MARNGSGTYTPPSNSWNPPVNGVTATANDWQTLLNDLAQGITQSVAADGQTPMSSSLDMDGNTVRQLGAPTGPGQAIRWQQFSKGSDIDSAAEIEIPVEGNFFEVTGTETISSIADTYPGRTTILRFEAGITLESSASLLLPGDTDIVTSAGDMAAVINTAPGVWTVMFYRVSNPGGILLRVDRFTSSGTWTKPTGLVFVRVRGIGGGGSGGGAQGTSSIGSAASGGGAGGVFDCIIEADDLGDTEDVSVGAGGSAPSVGRNDGNAGSESSFGEHVSGSGGAAGVAGTTSANSVVDPGSGGSATYAVTASGLMPSGSVGYDGGPGLVIDGSPRWSGQGGDSPFGKGGSARYGSANNHTGVDGIGYGSGGSGGKSVNTTSVTGGAGADGYVEVWSYVR